MNAIIPQLAIKRQQPHWQDELKDLFTDPLDLLAYLEISPDQIPWIRDLHFPLRVPRHFVNKMAKKNPHDPLLRQVLSVNLESQKNIPTSFDPLHESRFNPVPGLLHKYDSRVLLTFTPSCAVHCRYCFRRHFPYTTNNPGRSGWKKIIDYIADRTDIFEVILSGGDPLMANDDHIATFLNALSAIEHVKLLRFHTRLPVVIPSRINPNFINMLSSFRFHTCLIYHINHPNEIDASIAEGVKQLNEKGITVFNQSVLLKDINDDLNCLKKLSIDLYRANIIPYYIHLLDPVEGAGHFFVEKATAKALETALRAALPGYLVPRFVQELSGEKNKVPL